MHRFIFRSVPLVALSLILSGCKNAEPITAPPVDATKIDTFTGTLSLNGAAAYNFTVAGTGGITAQLTSLQPDFAKPVGLSLGTWNGSICQIVLDNPNAIQGQVVVGVASAVGEFCVRIYDAAGTVVQPQMYTIEVSHQ
jgi:hypothetical protein